MKTALESHAHGRPIVNCELWDERAQEGSTPLIRQGYITKRTRYAIWVSVPKSPGIKVFSTITEGDTYGYERRSRASGRGWRIDLSQVNLEEIPINDQTGTP